MWQKMSRNVKRYKHRHTAHGMRSMGWMLVMSQEINFNIKQLSQWLNFSTHPTTTGKYVCSPSNTRKDLGKIQPTARYGEDWYQLTVISAADTSKCAELSLKVYCFILYILFKYFRPAFYMWPILNWPTSEFFAYSSAKGSPGTNSVSISLQ